MKTVYFLLLSLLPAISSAQTLNLQQAIELAQNHDARISEKLALMHKAEAMLAEAQGSGGLRYSVDSFLALTTGVDGGFFENGEDSCSSNCTPRDDTYDFDNGLSLFSSLTFTIIKPLLTFGRLENYQLAAENNILIKKEDVLLQRDQIKLDITRAYYGYLTARDSRLLLEDTRKRLDAALELVTDWLDNDNGNAKLSDKFALQAGLGLVNSKFSEAKGLEAIAMEGIKVLTGLQGEEIKLEDRRLSPVPLPDRELEEWVETALNQRAEFRQVNAGLAARRALVEAKKADAKPIIFAGIAGSLAYSPERDRLDNPHIYDPFNHYAASPLLGMRWEWESGAQPARVAQAQAEYEAVVAKASFARNGIPFQVTEQYHLVHSRYESLQQMKNSAKAARRWMISAYTNFEAGLEEAEKILTAMQVYVLAYAEYLKIVNDYNNSVSKLNSVSGEYE